MHRARRLTAVLAAALPAAFSAPGAHAEDAVFSVGDFALLGSGPSRTAVGVGVFNAFGYAPDSPVPAAHAELMYGEKLFGIGPLVGVMANSEGGVFGFGGLYIDVRIGEKYMGTPFLGVGA
jgi:hypothetical protein